MEKLEQGKRAKNNRKRLHTPNNSDATDPLPKRPKSGGVNASVPADLAVSNTPSPSVTFNSSRPASVMSMASTVETMNGEEAVDHQGSSGSETNLEAAAGGGGGGGPGSTPVRKAGKSRLGSGKAVVVNRTSAPLGGRGKMQKSSGKKGGSRSSAAASTAGAIAGAKAATSAAYAAYGLPTHHLTTPSPGGSPAITTSTHSSPRVSPVPMAFVATSLVTTPPTGSKSSSKLQTSLTYANKNNI